MKKSRRSKAIEAKRRRKSMIPRGESRYAKKRRAQVAGRYRPTSPFYLPDGAPQVSGDGLDELVSVGLCTDACRRVLRELYVRPWGAAA